MMQTKPIEQQQQFSSQLNERQLAFQAGMDYNELLNCTRCGFCQPTCPTFVETGKEASSPRGRIALMKAVVDGVLEPDEHFEKELSLCLGCRACETACPSGVQYGQLLEQAREVLNQHKQYSYPVRLVRNLFFKGLFPHQRRLRFLGSLLWLYQITGLQWLVRKTKLLKLFPGNMADMESTLPRLSSPIGVRKTLATRVQLQSAASNHREATQVEPMIESHVETQIESQVKSQVGPVEPLPQQENQKLVSFFTGCIMDVFFLNTNENTIKLLQHADYSPAIPQSQVCCGALHAHSGELQQARELAKQNIVAFEQHPAEFIVTNAGGCGAFLKEYDHLLKDDPEWSVRANVFVSKVRDISEVLNRESLPPLHVSDQIVTYQDSCHLRNGMKVDSAPRALLQSINGVEFREMKGANQCCGSAGIYNLIETEMSMQILDHKMVHAQHTQARTIVTSNPGCLLQMKLGIKRAGLEQQVQAVHLVDLIAEALPDESRNER